MEFTPAFFDEASAAWKMNKKRVGQMYVYLCSAEGGKKSTDFCAEHKDKPAEHKDKPSSEKKLTHGYNLRSRSHHHAPVQRVYNTRGSMRT